MGEHICCILMADADADLFYLAHGIYNCSLFSAEKLHFIVAEGRFTYYCYSWHYAHCHCLSKCVVWYAVTMTVVFLNAVAVGWKWESTYYLYGNNFLWSMQHIMWCAVRLEMVPFWWLDEVAINTLKNPFFSLPVTCDFAHKIVSSLPFLLPFITRFLWYFCFYACTF